ncbi:MAG: hypothetical protein DMF69_06190 [Acidobacteria bacterium]|nr:MAG: hypothetical protein DMF69_06190 [Acidobacteriota bacterium]
MTTAQVDVPGASTTTVNYKYDPLGRRIQRSPSNGTAVNFVYDGEDVIEDLDTSGTALTRYLNGPGTDNKLRQIDVSSGTNYYFLADHLGSTRALTDASGDVVEQLSYDSFGKSGGSAITPFDYTGRERDGVTGLLYYRARWYDPNIGRFISEDPIGFAAGDVNLYSYVGQNPLSFRDPSGLDGTPGDLARWLESSIDEAKKFWTAYDPYDISGINNVLTRVRGLANPLHVGEGWGNWYWENPCTIGSDEFFADIGRASEIALTLAGGARGLGIGAKPAGPLPTGSAVPPKPPLLLRGVSSDPLTPAEQRAFSEIGHLQDVMEGRAPTRVLTEAERQVAARKYMNAAYNTRSSPHPWTTPSRLREYQLQRANRVLNDGPAPGTLRQWLGMP